MKNKFIAYIILVLMVFSLMPFALAEIFTKNDACAFNEVYVQDYGCVSAKYKISQRVFVNKDAGQATVSSIAGDIDPLKINNPWAAAGQPVVAQFTLENIGNEYAYPFNQIPLLPDSYALVLGVDKDIGVRTPDGKFIDVWNYMSWFEKFGFITKLSFTAAGTTVKNTLQGRQCGFVNVRSLLPDRATKYVDEKAGSSIAINMWQCLKIVDMPFFATELKSYCRDNIDNACLASINKDFGAQVSDVVTVALTSTESSGLSKGECARPWETASAIQKIFGQVKHNVVLCSIGDKGLQPGEKVTFDFVVLVPADAPVIPPKEIDQVVGLKEGYTQSVACANDKFASSCHSIYAAVYPISTENFFSSIAKNTLDTLNVGGCLFSAIFQAGTYNQCISTRGAGINTVGEPIWEGAGIFYIVGPTLRGSINLLIFAAYAGGIMMAFGVGRP